jgi:hypothetical protein
MSQHGLVTDQLTYGRTLVQAGVDGLLTAERSVLSRKPEHYLADSARSAVKAAAVGAGLGLLACGIVHRRRGRMAQVFACGMLAFCAEFAWETRALSSELIGHAAKEIAKVRDEHWLESNPIDYA